MRLQNVAVQKSEMQTKIEETQCNGEMQNIETYIQMQVLTAAESRSEVRVELIL